MEDAGQAEYWVAGLSDGTFCLTRKNKVSPIFGRRPKRAALRFWQEVNRVGKWEHLFDLSNPLTALPSSSLEFDIKAYAPAVFSPAIKREGHTVRWPDPIRLNHLTNAQQGVFPCFSIRVTNRSGVPLHVTILYLSNDYSISGILSIPKPIAPGSAKPLLLKDGKLIPIKVEECIAKAGVTVNPDRLKVITSIMPFSIKEFEEEVGLCPDIENIRGSLPTDQELSVIISSDWTVYNIDLINYKPWRKESLYPDSQRYCCWIKS